MDDNTKVEVSEDSQETTADNVEAVQASEDDNMDPVETVEVNAEQMNAIVNGVTLQSFCLCCIVGLLAFGLFVKGAAN